ncbi:MAG: nucleotidyltransferase domain-containing protein [Lachnospiraceae bacterium]|nr:nucleotidyltransferase domain-containing protein [Lachnospiraceae bacterium]
MKYDLSERLAGEICRFARSAGVEKIVLFGSRARGNNTERSDVDLAVYGGDFDSFYWNIQENVHSLLMFDLVNVDEGISRDLEEEIERDGIALYEKT